MFRLVAQHLDIKMFLMRLWSVFSVYHLLLTCMKLNWSLKLWMTDIAHWITHCSATFNCSVVYSEKVTSCVCWPRQDIQNELAIGPRASGSICRLVIVQSHSLLLIKSVCCVLMEAPGSDEPTGQCCSSGGAEDCGKTGSGGGCCSTKWVFNDLFLLLTVIVKPDHH